MMWTPIKVKPEYSNDRDLSYSAWHRTLDRKCYATNLDWIEYRYKNGNLTIVALLEEKDDRGNLKDGQKEIMIKMANALNVPAYLVKHNVCRRVDHKSSWNFLVENLITGEQSFYGEEEYKKFIENL